MQITLASKEVGDGGREEGRDGEEGENSKVKGLGEGSQREEGWGEKKYLGHRCGHYQLNHQCVSLRGDLQDQEGEDGGKQGDQENTHSCEKMLKRQESQRQQSSPRPHWVLFFGCLFDFG